MGLGFKGRFGMFVLISINVLFMLLGLALLIIGSVMKVDATSKVINKEEVVEALNVVSFNGNLKFGNVASSLSVLIICIGAVILAIAGLGGFGACCKNKCLLVTYAIVVLIVFIVQIIGVALWFTMQNKVDNTIQAELLKSMNNYEGSASSNEISIGWDLLFIGFDCCGIQSIESNRDQFASTKWTKLPNETVPYSCCESATEDNYKTVIEAACTQLISGYQKTGCYQAFKNFLKKYETAAIAIGITLLVIEIIGVMFAFVVCRAIGKKGTRV